jgi:molecular chaperone DnaJ
MAALGGEILIDSVNGKKVLKIPAGIQSGTVLTMREQGVPYLSNPNKKGDQQVHIAVETPTKLSDEEKSLLKKLADLRGESLTVQNPPKDDKDNGQTSLFDVIAGVFKPKNADE